MLPNEAITAVVPALALAALFSARWILSGPGGRRGLAEILQLHSALLRARELLETCDVNSHRFREAFEEVQGP